MIRKLLVTATLVATVAGCGGSSEPKTPTDPVLERQTNAGQIAMALEKPQQAVAQFRDALGRARERDDPAAIADAGFGLSVAELQANQPDDALRTAREVGAELVRRGVAVPPALQLAEAIALYRQGDLRSADALAKRVEAGSDAEAAARAIFLRGLIADDTGDAAELQAAANKLSAVRGDEHQADFDELSARLAIRARDAARARAAAEQAAQLRRDLLDYRSLARALALAAKAAELSGDTGAAADLYQRAGRTAAAEGDKASARRWLTQAISLSRDPALTQAAKSVLGKLDN